jgi:hypothetical protein
MAMLNVTFIRATIQLQTLIYQQGPNVQSMVNKSREKCYKFCASSDGESCLYIKFEVSPFGRYAPLPAVVPLLEAILQAIHCDPLSTVTSCLKSSELANHHPVCSFNCGKR